MNDDASLSMSNVAVNNGGGNVNETGRHQLHYLLRRSCIRFALARR
jgi:hypothetical protein